MRISCACAETEQVNFEKYEEIDLSTDQNRLSNTWETPDKMRYDEHAWQSYFLHKFDEKSS